MNLVCIMKEERYKNETRPRASPDYDIVSNDVAN